MGKDQSQLERLRNNDTSALKGIFNEYYPQLVNFAYRILGNFPGSADVAEDVVQDVFARLCAPGAKIDVKTSLSTYLYTSARNGALRAAEQRGRATYIDVDTVDTQPTLQPDALTTIEGENLDTAVARAVANLPERTRVVFTMQREQRLTYAQIAEVLGISLSTVKTHMERAVERLRKDLQSYL